MEAELIVAAWAIMIPRKPFASWFEYVVGINRRYLVSGA